MSDVEIWKDVESYEGRYQVSNFGRVRSLNYNRTGQSRVLKPGKCNKYGHLSVCLCKDCRQKTIYVHKLVGHAFVSGWFEGSVINHKDHDPSNNVYSNLEWTTQKENCSSEKSFSTEINRERFTNGILSKKVIQFTKSGEFVREWPSIMEIKRQLGFNDSSICSCCNDKRQSAYGFRWRYAQEAQ